MSHQLSDFLGVIVSPLQIHQLGGGSLYGAVSARDDARLEQLPSRIIPSHFHLARYTLANVDHHHAAIARLAQFIDNPWICLLYTS